MSIQRKEKYATPVQITGALLLIYLAVYLDPVSQGNTKWPASTLVDGIPDIENITAALHHGPYGKCVYESDNDVCDHQVCGTRHSRHLQDPLTQWQRWSTSSSLLELQPPSQWWRIRPLFVNGRHAFISRTAR